MSGECITGEIWQRYKETRSRELRNRILMAYMPVVTCNARKMYPIFKGLAETQDIVNQGVLALMECIDKYEFDRGVQFDSYASIRVRGSIIDYVRKQDWIPRGARKKYSDIQNAYQELQSLHGRPATDGEVAQRLGIDLPELERRLSEVAGLAVLSFEELLQENLAEESEKGFGNPERELLEGELKKTLTGAIDRLEEKERTVVSLYYYEELKMKEIALVMGLTASRVSQLHAKAIMKLRGQMHEYLEV
ncbi:MAG TPA: FliA/WhiG family RNA polymerase sigma factor [Terriglobales bacterium]|nr:FliA/WhiG family RNA polymerase sigma factor [Terriglobales bacterium]